jgi:hypothetical protein
MGKVNPIRAAEHTKMTVTQEFLVLRSNGAVRVYSVRNFPSGTFVDRQAKRMRVVGPVWVRPPSTELTDAQWASWQDQLQSAGFSVTVEAFWTSSPTGRYQPLESVRDELLRSAR